MSSQERLSIYHLQGHSSEFISHEKYYCCQLNFLLTQQLLTELSRKLKAGPERQGDLALSFKMFILAW